MKPAADTRPGDTRPVIAAYGDSLMEGWGLANAAEALPARIEAELARLGKDARVLNFGISGETAPEGLERLEEVLAAQPVAAILEFGANDCYQGVPVEETRAALQAMIAGLKGAGVKVLLAGWRTTEDLFSRYEGDPDLAGLLPLAPPAFNAKYVRAFNAMHAELAREHGLALIGHILDPLGEDARHFQADAVHPNARGTQKLAEALAPLLLPLLG